MEYINIEDKENKENKENKDIIYKEIEKEIQCNGYENVLNQSQKNLIEKFKEMLDYKGKQYDSNWDFEKFIRVIDNYYNSYTISINEIYQAINYKYVRYSLEDEPIPVNETETIMIMRNFLQELSNYKDYAYVYRDFDLNEGQTYEDLYLQEEKKLEKLFKEMLDFLNVKYSEDEKYGEQLRIKVSKYYPEFKESISLLSFPNVDDTYIEMLDTMESVYEKLSKKYFLKERRNLNN